MFTAMELSTLCISNHLPNLASFTSYTSTLKLKLSLPFKPNSTALNNKGLRYYKYKYSFIKATASEETSNEVNQYVKEESDAVSYSSIEATTPEVASNGVNQYVEEESNAVNYSSIDATSEEASNGVNQYVNEEPDAINNSSIEATTPEEASNESNQYVKEESDAVNNSSIEATSEEESDGVNEYVKEESVAVNNSSIEATTPEEASNEVNQYVKVEPDAVNYSSIEETTPEEESNGVNQYVKEETDDVVTVNESQSDFDESSGFGLLKDDAAADDQSPQDDFLNKLKVELGLEDPLSIALLGVGGITALWLTASIVGAIDHIPLFPKLMELVGLGYTIWFSTRYLLFKRSRDELALKIEEIKQQVLGSKN